MKKPIVKGKKWAWRSGLKMKRDRIKRPRMQEKAGNRKRIRCNSRTNTFGMARQMLTFFHPSTGEARVKGVTQSTNAILYPWVKEQIEAILKTLPEKPTLDEGVNRQLWTAWQVGLSRRITLSEDLPLLRMLLIRDNLQGHHTREMVLWLFAHGVMPLFIPLGGFWLRMAESIQRVLARRGLAGQNPETPNQIINWLEPVACALKSDPTPFE